MADYFAQFTDPDASRVAWPVEHEAEVGVEKIAAVYAEALLDVAEKAGRIDDVLEEFGSFLAVLDAMPSLERVLGSALVSHDEKTRLLDKALGGRASREFLNFLKVLSRHGRLDVLRPVHRAAKELREKRLNRVRVIVATAAPIDDDLAQRVAERIRPLIDGQPVVERIVDPGVIGGIVVRVGDTIFDASLATQLKNLRQQIIDRSAHEIQSRRDRFRTPAGN